MFDIFIFIVILIFMYKGYQKGFEKELGGVISLAGGLVLGVIFYAVLAALLCATPLPDWLGGLTSNSFLEKISSAEVGNGTVNQIFGSITHEENKTRIIGEFMVKFLSFVLVFAAGYVALKEIFKRKKVFKKLRIVRQLRPALGGVCGLFKGIAYCYIALAMLVIAEPVISTNFVRNQVEKSEIARFMYEDNYIANIIAQHDYLTSEG